MKYDQVQMYILEMIIQIRFKLLSLYLYMVKCSYNTLVPFCRQWTPLPQHTCVVVSGRGEFVFQHQIIRV